jgi:hypothetical protein
VASPISS